MHWRGLHWRQGYPKKAVEWSRERECRCDPEPWPQDGPDWQFLEAQLKNLL